MRSKEEQMEQIEEIFCSFAAEYPYSALSLITGLFVGVVEHAIEEKGGNPNLEIVIDGGVNRNITLSAIKAENTENVHAHTT